MEYEIKEDFIVPASIQLLFSNRKLEIMKLLSLLQVFSNQSNKQRKVEEILFYYSLVNFDLSKLFEENITIKEQRESYPSPNQYFRFQIEIKELLLLMSDLGFVEINGKLSDKVEDLKVKLLLKGRSFFEANTSEYLNNLLVEYETMLGKIVYSVKNVKKIKGE